MADLFDRLSLLDSFPDETLFSVVSRLHHLWGHPLAGQTCAALFGHPQQGSQHDLPGRLATFVSRTNGRYGAVPDLAFRHTLLAYYRPFATEPVVSAAVHSMSTDSVAHLKLKLGILTSRFRAHHPLKACLECVREDVMLHGWSYWHLSHQYPGVWVCLKHGCWLQVSSLKATGVSRFQWMVPTRADLRAPDGLGERASSRHADAAQSLSRLVAGLVFDACDVYPMDVLQKAYTRRLSDMGLIRAGGSFRWPEIGRLYAQHLQMLGGCPDIPVEMASSDKVTVHLGRMLRNPRSGTHPLRHILIIHWLFGDAAALAQAIGLNERWQGAKVAAGLKESQPSSASWEASSHMHRLKDLLVSEGLTLSAAARCLEVDVATAMTWAAKMRIEVPRRPKLLKDAVRGTAVAMLRSGANKEDVGLKVGVSVQTVTRLLLTEVDLHEQWKDARWQTLRHRNRSAWTSLVSEYEAAGVKILREMEPSVYAWLYRNDRDWLVENKPKPFVCRASGMRRVDWDARDRGLSDQVRVVAHQLAQARPDEKIKLWQIYQELPEMRAKLGALDRLPLTRMALEDVITAGRRAAVIRLLE